jgi:hypothetical protein
VTGNRTEVINRGGKSVARVGDWLRTGGVAVEDSRTMAGFDEMIPGMPIEVCPGPYWAVVSLETMAE